MPETATKAIFLSYARDDASAARRIAEALRSGGLEVWFDENELRGGDAWDAKIRRQINECTLFIAVISQHTESRSKGYFRLEWKLAVEQTHMLLEGVPFIVPVVIDDTSESGAAVPPEFLRVQWTRLPGGLPTPQFVEQITRLLAQPRKSTMETGRPRPAERAEGGASPKKSRASLWPWAAAGVAAIALVAFFATRKSEPPPKPVIETKPAPPAPATASPSTADPKSIAVLAFANLSADKDNEYFSDGLSENILDKLARVPGLRVMARTSSFSYKGRNVTAQQIGQELHVGTVIEGSVMRAGNQLRITAQLINAADGTHVWSEQFDRELTTTGIFAMQDEIALKIAARLAPAAVATPAASALPTQNLAAYESYLRGRDLFTKNTTFWTQGVTALERAVELDSKFALAWLHLGYGRARLYAYRSSGDLSAAKLAIDEALRLQPDLPEAHLALASLLAANGTHLNAALQELDLAEKIRPGDPQILVERASYVMQQGHRAEAITLVERAVQLDPRNGLNLNVLGVYYGVSGRYAEAEKAYERAFQILGSSILLNNLAGLQLTWKGDGAAAIQKNGEIPAALRGEFFWQTRALLMFDAGDLNGVLESFAKVPPDESLGYAQALICAAIASEARGVATEAERRFRAAAEVAETFRQKIPLKPVPYATLAIAYAGLGRREDALAMARKSLELVPPEETPYLAALGGNGRAIGGLYALVFVQARFGMIDEALAIVKTQIAAGWWRRNYLLISEDWRELRKDPRFREIAEKAPL